MNKTLTNSNNSVKSSANSRSKKKIGKRKKGVFVFGSAFRVLGLRSSFSGFFVFATTWPRLIVKNYRPISNLQYVSKLVERAVFEQTHRHMVQHHIYPVLQSSYRAGHSTETALLKFMNDIMQFHEFTMCHASCISIRPQRGV